MSESNGIPTLDKQEALDLWHQGYEVWNAWVVENPKYNVCFDEVNFEAERRRVKADEISFFAYKFPKGDVTFRGAQFDKSIVNFTAAQFGIGNVDFSRARFSNSRVDFSGARFGKGVVNFNSATFGDDGVYFNNVVFGDGDVIFNGARFGKSEVSFDRAEFGKGEVSFDRAQFNGLEVSFQNTRFGDGNVDFKRARFGDGDVIFYDAQFGKGEVSFQRAVFGKSEVSFDRAHFGDGNVYFKHAQFGDGNVDFISVFFGSGYVFFENVQFGKGDVAFLNATFKNQCLSFKQSTINGNLHFSPSRAAALEEPLFTGGVNFSEMTIDGFLSIGEFRTASLIDLTNTRMGHPIQLDKTEIGYQQEESYTRMWPLYYRKAVKENSSRCYRQLKKYAEEAKDHERKLAFFANEMRCDYGYGLTGCKLYLYLLYDKLSDYGRSFTRPGKNLFYSTLIFFFIYLGVSLTQSTHKTIKFLSVDTVDAVQSLWGHAFVLAAAHSVPFSFGSRSASKKAMDYLFDGAGDSTIIWMHGLTLMQGVVSTIFLFLIGLALRNFFRS